ncbi:MAG: addiction module protein [Gemmataceae bacterium]
MLPTTEQLLHTALALPPDERALLIESLLAAEESPPFDDSWREVVQRRSAELDSGTVQPIPWSEVRGRLRANVQM